MANFVFWNINKKPIIDYIVTLSHAYKIDILMLAESDIPQDIMLKALNTDQEEFYFPDPGFSSKLQIFTRYLRTFVKPLRDSGGIAIRHIEPPVGNSFLLAVVHLASKIYQTEDDQIFSCIRLAKIIIEEERKIGHNRTILIGDLNMNPFEKGIISADGLHALNDHRIVQRGYRRVGDEERIFFIILCGITSAT